MHSQKPAPTRLTWYPELIVFYAASTVFWLLWRLNIPTDIQPHASYVVGIAKGSVPLPANFLYYLLLYLVSFGKVHSWQMLSLASAVLLGSAVAAKFSITRRILARDDAFTLSPPHQGKISPAAAALLLSCMLLVAFSVPMRLFYPQGRFYLGQIPPNVWHNSTTIFLMPFALILFWLSYRQLEQPENTGRIRLILLFCALNIFVKPSFIFPFVVVYPLFMLKRTLRGEGGVRLFLANMTPVLVAGVLTLAMYLLIYAFSFSTIVASQVGKSSVAIQPFFVWRSFSHNMPLSFFLSILYPAAYLLLYPKERLDPLLRYAWSLYCVSVLIFILFAETGPRAMHGNFFWQAVVCAYTLFFATTLRFGRRLFSEGRLDWKSAALGICLGVHVVSGMVYLVSLFVRRTFL